MWIVLALSIVINLLSLISGDSTADYSECPDAWVVCPASQTCVKAFDEKKSWMKARSSCLDQDADLVRILDGDMNTFINGLLNTTANRKYWIGLHDRKTENDFVWLNDTTTANYTSWAKGQPNNFKTKRVPMGQDCAEIGTFAPNWQDDWCTRKSHYICERPKFPPPQCPPDDWKENPTSKTCIKLIKSKKSWKAARAFCKQQNADLLKVPDAATNAFASSVINNNKMYVWTGVHDRDEEGKYFWLDEVKEVNYTNWDTDQPNNYRNQDCMCLLGPKWHDHFCTKPLWFLCERRKRSFIHSAVRCEDGWTPSPESGTCVKIFVSRKETWSDARKVCAGPNGGDLVKIVNDEMNTFINGESKAPRGPLCFGVNANVQLRARNSSNWVGR
ncbi:macrophage mannose receptor 1-like [Elysia marginata]|uniref:Macrophage mannose receptor 1-like n=1 Tax=Elysia marginata TaxID=1093978 RepID=A0AAV4JU79_9GAST|nr:macrophage mannose receptor 1-like [Elysia marginata]